MRTSRSAPARSAALVAGLLAVAACGDYILPGTPEPPPRPEAPPLEGEDAASPPRPVAGENRDASGGSSGPRDASPPPVVVRDAGDTAPPPPVAWEPPPYGAVTPSGPGHVIYLHPDGKYRRVEATVGAPIEVLDTALDRLSPGEDTRMNLSRDGAWLVAETSRFGCSTEPCLAVSQSSLAAGELVRIGGQPVRLGGSMMAIGAQGRLIIFGAGGAHATDLYSTVKTAAGWSEPRVLSAASTYDYNQRPALSPDARKVAFDCGPDPSGGERGAICEVNVDGTGFRVLRTSAGILNLHSPSYAPDGTIVLEHEQKGVGEEVFGEQIYKFDPATTTPEYPLAPTYSNDNSPCVLPNGNIVSLWLQRPGNDDGWHELRMMSPTGTPIGMLAIGYDLVDIGEGCGN